MSDKIMTQLNDMLESEKTQDYFRRLSEKAKEIIIARKPPSILGKFSKILKKGDDLPDVPGMK